MQHVLKVIPHTSALIERKKTTLVFRNFVGIQNLHNHKINLLKDFTSKYFEKLSVQGLRIYSSMKYMHGNRAIKIKI